MANTYYPRIIRKLVVGFGNLFDDITLVRYNPDQTEAERFIVPIAYATKEKYVQRLEGDANLDKKVQMTLPRMSFEMSGLSYDASRKQNTNIKNFSNASGTIKSQYNPVPYNFDFNLYVYVRNVEDGTQIIEHILPYFTPDYTIKLNLIPEMGIIKEVPVVLNSTSYDVEYEGVRDSDPRLIIWTLNFTVKGFIFGASTGPVGLIKTSITNILNDININDNVILNTANTGVGTYQVGEFVYQGYSIGTAVATGKVVSFVNNKLTLTNINGNFVSTQPIIGQTTNANYAFTSFQVAPLNYAQIVITPNPNTANANSAYTYTTNITETPNIANTYPKV
jgi:T4-like virus Myoviridae tail sheath stabiliser